MEYKKLCKTCGHVFCYTDADIAKSRQANGLSALSAIGSIAGALSGNWMAARANQAEMHDQEKQVLDFDHCPNCRSTNLVSISDKELEEIRAKEIVTNTKATISINANASIDSIIKRIQIFIEEGEWERAEAYCEQALDLEPENGDVYFLKLHAVNRQSNTDSLALVRDILNTSDFRLAKKYGNQELQYKLNELEERASIIHDREMALYKKEQEEKHKKAIQNTFENAKAIIASSNDKTEINQAIDQLNLLGAYSGADQLIVKGKEKLVQLEENKKKTIKAVIIISVVLAVLGVSGYFASLKIDQIQRQQQIEQQNHERELNYAQAVANFKAGEYSKALAVIKKGTIGKANSKYQRACEVMLINLNDPSEKIDVGDIYDFYYRLSDSDEDEKYIKTILSETDIIKLYDNLLGEYEVYDDEILGFYSGGRVTYWSLSDYHLYANYGDVYISSYDDDYEFRKYLPYWEDYIDKKPDYIDMKYKYEGEDRYRSYKRIKQKD